MSVKVHEAFSIDSFQDRLLWYDDFLGDQLKDEWGASATGGGTSVVVDAQTGGIVRLTTGATSGNFTRVDWADIRSLHVSKKVTLEDRVKLNQATNLEAILALYFDASNRIRFQFNETVGGAINWNIECRNGGATTSLDSGVTIDTDYHIYRIEAFPTGQVHFYIDGVETANSPIITNIPDDAGDYLQPFLRIVAREDAAKSMDADYVVVRQEI